MGTIDKFLTHVAQTDYDVKQELERTFAMIEAAYSYAYYVADELEFNQDAQLAVIGARNILYGLMETEAGDLFKHAQKGPNVPPTAQQAPDQARKVLAGILRTKQYVQEAIKQAMSYGQRSANTTVVALTQVIQQKLGKANEYLVAAEHFLSA